MGSGGVTGDSYPAIFGGRYARFQAEPPREGGMAIVFHCADLKNPTKQVAVKTIHRQRDVEHLEELIRQRELNAKELSHDNIVELLDVNTEDDGTWFLVYEWLPENLKSWMARQDSMGTDDVVERVGLPILRALAAAHERQVLHRDVKPSNVMMTAEGVPKLTDFGISKHIYSSDESDLLANAHSRPFTPPNEGYETRERRDVFSFGVLMLWALTFGQHHLADYSDIETALELVDGSPELVDLLRRCVSFDHHERPASAVELLTALEDLQSNRQKKWTQRRPIYLRLTKAAKRIISEENELSDRDLAKLVEDQLSDGPAVRLLNPNSYQGRVGEKQAFIFGSEWSFRLAFAAEAPTVEVVGAKRISVGESDFQRDTQFVAESWDFKCTQTIDHAAGEESARLLLEAVEVFESDQAIERQSWQEQSLFEEWRKQLDAREAADSQREDRIAYESVEVTGQRARFTVDDGIDRLSIEQRRCVLNENSWPIAFGEVEWIDGRFVDIYLDNEPRAPLPRKGRLALDTLATREVLRRERSALNALRFCGPQLRRTDLPQLLVHPSEVEVVEPPSEINWSNAELDDSKKAAIRGALGSKDFFVVEGPPGTGKTTFIAELVAQEIQRNSNVRIVLASQSNVALDNALERIMDLSGDSLRMLRLGNPAEGKISESVSKLTLDSQLDNWRTEVRQRSERFLDAFARQRDVDLSALKVVVLLHELASVLEEATLVRADIDDLEEIIEDGVRGILPSQRMTADELQVAQEELAAMRLRRTQLDRDARHLRETKVVAKPLRGLPSHDPSAVRSLAETILGSATTDPTIAEMVKLQSKWLERLSRRPEFEAALLEESNVVAATCVGLARNRNIDEAPFDLCILDEASKAAVTESLIPMIRAKRWVLVGDDKQLPPHLDEAFRDPSVIKDFGLDQSEVGGTIFGRLAKGLPAETHTAPLSTQYRMVQPIGGLISECFYQDRLKSFPIDAPWDLSLVQRAPVTWYTTESFNDRHEMVRGQDAPSYINPLEARGIFRHLERLNFVLRSRLGGRRPAKVLVLAPYRLQVAHILKQIDSSRQKLDALEIEVGTVDAVQGREAEILLVSTVRSNETGHIGFVRDYARANVALSRGRYSLTLFGDAAFFDRTEGPMEKVLSYIRRNPRACALEPLAL
ncbi:MAG: protein kinase [Fimbriimonadaceae bacterium]|nr:protein kinase [Fimbriimonadaceae bacterium]